jgi:hypothetical protein
MLTKAVGSAPGEGEYRVRSAEQSGRILLIALQHVTALEATSANRGLKS